MTRVYVRPLDGLKVHDEFNPRMRIPVEGKEVLMTGYIQRRINDGALEICDPPRTAEGEE